MTRFERLLVWLVLATTQWVGCASDDVAADDEITTWTEQGPAASGDGCQPLTRQWDCLLPYPSDFLRVRDATTASGYRVQSPPKARPLAADGVRIGINGQRLAAVLLQLAMKGFFWCWLSFWNFLNTLFASDII